ncbi:calcium-binding protein [Rhizobium herbae]|uniref:Ca2+-binding RTX toxin-like protein n=1 Tax=Rhizobium herbae TaxID=508661 RepID=A0ABS4EVD1_9HYPH|nr:calcium-binding protein [Rhizobium herbae]MBP1861916.1 Ca2+-binding RTX toxin-like protein [Rhizobium herbae]
MRFSLLNNIADTIWWDNLRGTDDADMIEIGFGNDTVSAMTGDDVIWDKDGAQSEDIWLGSDDRIFGDYGNDLIFGGWGSDLINGGMGRDTLDYRYSRAAVVVDLINGEGRGGDDSASKGDTIISIEEVHGSRFGDTMISKTNQKLFGDEGNDRLTGGTASSELFGGAGDDYFVVLSASNSTEGGGGFDTVDFHGLTYGVAIGYTATRAVANAIGARLAGAGGEKVIGTSFADYIHLGALSFDPHAVNGMEGNDTIRGGGGDDVFNGGIGDDVLLGGSGNDTLHGDAGNDRLEGEYGDNRMFGDAGNDILIDGYGTDVMNGGAGNDRLEVTFGEDVLTGGAGVDLFVFNDSTQFYANPIITDFSRTYDKIDLSAIDSVRGVSGNQTFVFDRTDSGSIGTVHSEIVGDKTIITTVVGESYGYVSDMEITLNGRFVLSAVDFIL